MIEEMVMFWKTAEAQGLPRLLIVFAVIGFALLYAASWITKLFVPVIADMRDNLQASIQELRERCERLKAERDEALEELNTMRAENRQLRRQVGRKP